MSEKAQGDLKYKRVLLKLSGEALMGDDDYGINMQVAARIANDIKEAAELGVEFAIVVGGGNIFRGVKGAAGGMERGSADYMGMLATVMNALAMQSALVNAGLDAHVQSAIPMPTVCEPFNGPRARQLLADGGVVFFAAGTGNPYFTTDTAAALRAAEMHCDVIAKATQVDGVYSADPKIDKSATRFSTLTFDEVLARNLKVMDAAAIALARDNDIPMTVFSVWEPGNLARVLSGKGTCTTITN